jgi:hypothetical protein
MAPAGSRCERRAIQLGLRADTRRAYATKWIVAVKDITSLVLAERKHARREPASLKVPREDIYPVAGPIAGRLGISAKT